MMYQVGISGYGFSGTTPGVGYKNPDQLFELRAEAYVAQKRKYRRYALIGAVGVIGVVGIVYKVRKS